jgi:hypothetical protein
VKRLPRPETLLVLVFLTILAAPAIIQATIEWRHNESVQALSVFRERPTSANLRSFEHTLEDESWLGQELRPWVQYAHFAWFQEGGDKAIVGRDGWLFYRPGFQYLTERPELSPPDADHDPLPAICAYRDQLAARGIRLLVVLAPNKESIYPELLARRATSDITLACPQTRQLLNDLAESGVDVVDLGAAYRAAKQAPAAASDEPLYLRQDTHWSPAGVEIAARTVAQRLLDLGWVSAGSTRYYSVPAPVARLGDLVHMLQVPQIESATAPEDIACRQIVRSDTHELYRDDPHAEILVMGDSFLRIYEQDEPRSAGFIAHLAQQLQQPLTSLVNDGGASTLVRQQLYRRGDLLDNKRVIVWEFVERDIRFGMEGWQLVPVPPPSSSPPPPGHSAAK